MVSVPGGVPAGTNKVLVRAEAGGQSREESFDLNVVFLPAGFVGEELKEKDGRWWFERIVFQPPGAGQERVEFVLVRKTAKDHPPTFYIMRHKVWVGPFHRFAAAAAQENRPVTWKSSDRADEDHPALGVPLWEAHRFATEWLHGNLPTARQWDQAAGRYEPSREGPFGTRKAGSRLRIAVDIPGPLPTHRAETDDVSPFGCRDMSGNGLEWTRSQPDSGAPLVFAEPMPEQDVATRGKKWTATEPLTFQQVQQFSPNRSSQDKDSQMGFRVVIEP
jgi:formylglycine-generating enzyme required for sulfatase activity